MISEQGCISREYRIGTKRRNGPCIRLGENSNDGMTINGGAIG